MKPSFTTCNESGARTLWKKDREICERLPELSMASSTIVFVPGGRFANVTDQELVPVALTGALVFRYAWTDATLTLSLATPRTLTVSFVTVALAAGELMVIFGGSTSRPLSITT